MNRRKLLKQAGVMLAAPYLFPYKTTAGAECPPSGTKDLVVTFVGPFCCWSEEKKKQSIKMMAPPIGPDNTSIPHQAWFSTTANELPIVDKPCEKPKPSPSPCFVLSVPVPKRDIPPMSGTPIFRHPYPKDDGTKPFFSINVPAPDHAIGLDAVCAQINGKDGPFASGMSFFYKNVELSKVVVCKVDGECYENVPCDGKEIIFRPNFSNDDCLPMATLVVHLAPLMLLDCDHVHAKAVWKAMQSMFTGLDLKIEYCPNTVAVGGGNDCQAPLMWFPN